MENQKGIVPKNSVLRLIKGHREEGPVCSSPLVSVTLDQMKNSGFYYPNAHNDPRAMAMLASSAYVFIGFQGIRVPFDLCVEAEAFGCKLRNGNKESAPSVIRKALGENEVLSVPEGIFEKGRFKVVFEALRILNSEFGNKVPIFAGMVGPLTLVRALYGTPAVMGWLINDPKRMNQNLENAADFLSTYAKRLLEAGGDVLAILDPPASGDTLGSKYFQRFMLPVYQGMRKKIEMPVILHICGNTLSLLEWLPRTGFEGFSFEGLKVSARTARQKIKDKMLLVGNIPNYDILLFGTPEKVREESLKALKDGIDMLAPSCGVPIQTPTENLKAMVRAVEEFRETM